MNTIVVSAIDLFTSDELGELENLVQNLPPLPKL
jgi:hypothetical protein